MYEILIEGMNCKHCIMSVKEELLTIDGIELESVEIGKVLIKNISIDESLISGKINEAGFKVIAINRL